MNVAVSVFGRLHAFYLADQLHHRSALECLYTTYPKYEARKYGIPASKVKSWPLTEAAFRGWLKLPFHESGRDKMLLRFAEMYDATVKKHLHEPVDLFHGWSTYSEESLSRSQELGAIGTVQRGSAHIAFQNEILREEYQRWGTHGVLPQADVIQRELREYDIADAVFVPSTFARDTFLQRGIPADKIITSPLGVSLKEFYPSPCSDDVFRVIYVGTMSLQKGVQYLLQAFAELNLNDAELWLIGMRQRETETFFRKYEGHYRYFDPVPQAELRELYSQCSVSALCSIQDGFGVVLMQAMACGLPVLCTTNTGGPDLIENGQEGFILPIRDVEALKDRILYLYQNRDLCADMGRRAALRAATSFTWHDYDESMYRAFAQLLSSRDTYRKEALA